jgi:hypothetical protein
LMQATSVLVGTEPVLQSAAVDQVPLMAVFQLSVHVGFAALLGVADTSANVPAEPNDAIATAAATATLRNPTMLLSPISCVLMPSPAGSCQARGAASARIAPTIVMSTCREHNTPFSVFPLRYH